MHPDVDQYETSTTHQPLTRSCLLFSLPKPHELPVKECNLESLRGSAPALMLQTQVKGGQIRFQNRCKEEGRVLHLLTLDEFLAC